MKFKVSLRGDDFGWRVPAFVAPVLCAALAMTTLPAAGAKMDFSLGTTARSYPLSGVIEAEAGYDLLLWGNPTTPFYGYLRPRLYGSSAGTYNSVDAALEFFPLAFLGGRAGAEWIQNDQDYSSYDCVAWRCRGRFQRSYIEGELSLGAGPVFVQGKARRERWKGPVARGTPAEAGEFIDPTSGLALLSDGDDETVYTAVAGVRFGPDWAVLAALRYATGRDGGFSRQPVGLLRYRQGGFSLGAGAGTFASTLKKRDFTAVGFLRWEIAPGLGLR